MQIGTIAKSFESNVGFRPIADIRVALQNGVMRTASEVKIVILPGLDGTAILSADVAKSMQNHLSVTIIEYPKDVFLDYDGLAAFVAERLPTESFILIAESFAGPLALKIASLRPSALKGVVLAASFARLDLPFKPVLRLLASVVPPRAMPTAILAFLLLGRWATAARLAALRTALSTVDSKVLAKRAKAALEVDLIAGGTEVFCPVLYLRAKSDRLIPKSAGEGVAQICKDMRIVGIDAPHFILQASASASASVIHNFSHETFR